jgi:general stress protein CsbA
MIWIALIVVVVLAAGVLGTLLEIALWAVTLTVLVVVAGGLLLAKNVRSGRSGAKS